jgi:hypothetical protein
MKSYGRAPTFLLATGYEQARSIAAALAGDWAAARDVQLELPETGVCSSTLGAKAMLDDAATRYGLAPEIPAQLISAAVRHLPAAGSVAAATRAAAAELGVDADVALQLAALTGDQFDRPDAASTTGRRRPDLDLVTDREAARDVQVALPEAGVWSHSRADDEATRGKATGVSGGLRSLPLIQVGASASQTGGCCG